MGGSYDEDTTSSVALQDDDAPQLCALVSVDGGATMHALPALDEIDIGRSSSCDLVLDHPSVSRRHATLHTRPLAIMDVGSRNGTRLRGQALAAGVTTPFSLGEAIAIGEVTVLIQPLRVAPAELRGATKQTSDALMRQLDIERARSARSGSPFAYVRVHVERGNVAQEQLRATLRVTDVIASARGAYQLLLPDTSAQQLVGALSRVRRLVADCGATARIAAARYPFDGTTPEALLARVWEQLDAPAEATEMDAVRALIAQVAASDVSVLITGETGVGKELCAEMIHRQSPRAGRPFVKLNCSAITESLLESELFGHERGAFTGAINSSQGLLESGNGGTVFLDEIGELSLPAQSKLLRVLEERVVRRVGSTVGRELDVRFVCATNRSLRDEVDARAFRGDLYYRIEGVTIAIPPLRERVGEIAALARAFVARRGASVSSALTPEVLDALRAHSWPGNIRELRNTIERALVLADGEPLMPEHLSLDGPRPRRSSIPTMPAPRVSSSDITIPPPLAPHDTGDRRLSDTIAEVERQRILDALERCEGNQTRAARMLGISRNTLLARLDAYGLPRPRKS
jgi:two-component system, NtrC family, response regulator AtoC